MRNKMAVLGSAMILTACIIGCIGCNIDIGSDDDTTTTYEIGGDGQWWEITIDGDGNTQSVVRADGTITEEGAE